MKIKFILFLAIAFFQSFSFANTPWIVTLGCVPGFDKMDSFLPSFQNKKERMEIIASVSETARLAGSKHRVGAFGYFNDLNEVVDSGFCDGDLGAGSSNSFKNVKCTGKHFSMVLGFDRNKCTVSNGIKECIMATDAENHSADITFFSDGTGFSSNVMTCRKRTYGPDQPIDSTPVF